MSRNERVQIAQQTLQIIASGMYEAGGKTVTIPHEIAACRAGTQVVRLQDWPAVQALAASKLAVRAQGKPTSTVLLDETTFRTCQRWAQEQGLPAVACLNFASAKNPGGGFLGGSQAQEEALSRASGLYESLLQAHEYYDHNRKSGTCLYSDYMIWSPAVPVFRDDADRLLPKPFVTGILTSPAVNAGCIRQNEPHKVAAIKPVMEVRAEKLLALAVVQGVEHLVLGAWGCGVFGNDPREVAAIFADLLHPGGRYGRAFTTVAFSIPCFGASRSNWEAFREFFPSAH